MKIILHIGCEKTGTTSIQRALVGARELLLSDGVLYPKLFGSENHMEIAAACADDDAESELRLIELNKADCDLEEYRRRLSAAIADEVANSKAHTVIFSNEHCHSRICSPSEFARLRDLLCGVTRNIEVLIYLRRQDLLAVSLYSTKLKLGGNDVVFPGAKGSSEMYYFDFASIIERYEKTFGEHAIKVRIYEPKRLYESDAVKDFYSTCGLGDPPPQSKRFNKSLSRAQVGFLRRFNIDFPLIRDGKINVERGPIYDTIRNTCTEGGAFYPARESAKVFYEKFRGGNTRIRQRYFPECEGESLFDEDFSKYPDCDADDALSEKQLFEFIAAIWRSRKK